MTDTPFYLKQRHIELLIFLDQTRHLGRTAELLHMSQPAASKALAQIERQAGEALFLRTGTGTEPTPLGEMVIAHAKNLTGSARRLALEINALRQRNSHLLRIGILPSASVHITPELVSELLNKEPRLEITVHEGLLHDLLDRLVEEDLDCVIGRGSGQAPSNYVEGRFLYSDPICIVCGVNNLWASRKKIHIKDLMQSMWILPVDGTVMGDRMSEMFEQLGVRQPSRYMRSNAVLTNIALMNRHPWISAFPGTIAQHFQTRGAIKILPVDTKINFGNMEVMVRKNAVMDTPLRLLMDTLTLMFPQEG